jgi:cytidylate kinase
MIITLDGPTASGKSSVARLLAEKLGILYLNTGFLYRALAYILTRDYHYTREQLAAPNPEHIHEFFNPENIRYDYTPQIGARVFYKDQDITPYLKTPEADQWASIASAQPIVRAAILELQRTIADSKSLVAEGRDTGSIIYPNAEYKFFLTAPVEIRAKRWQEDKNKVGIPVTYEEALASLKERDTRDTTRAIAPLVVPTGAHVIDDGTLTVPETVQYIISFIDGVARDN